MMKCNERSCRGEGLFAQAGFCLSCWHKLPAEQQRAIMDGRAQGQQQEVRAIAQAKAWLAAHPETT